MTELVRLCRAEEVNDGEPVAANVNSFPPLAVYNVDGEFFVTDNTCTHGSAMLTDGYQEGSTIECPFHGGAFDIRTGAATVFPCQVPIKVYPVTLDDGWIAIPAQADGEAPQ